MQLEAKKMTTSTEENQKTEGATADASNNPQGKDAEPSYVRSRKQPIWHIVVITFFTLTLYVPFWVFKTCRLLKKYARAKQSQQVQADTQADSLPETAALTQPKVQPCEESIAKYANCRPWLSALISVIPFIHCFVFASLFRDMACAIPDKQNYAARNATFAGLALTLAMACLWMLGRLDGPPFLLFTLVSIPMAIAQGWLNMYWDKVEPGEYPDQTVMVRGAFSPWELIAIVTGGMAVALVVVGFSVSTP